MNKRIYCNSRPIVTILIHTTVQKMAAMHRKAVCQMPLNSKKKNCTTRGFGRPVGCAFLGGRRYSENLPNRHLLGKLIVSLSGV